MKHGIGDRQARGYNLHMKKETREALELFVEKTQELKNGRFAEYVKKNGVTLNISIVETEAVEFSLDIPDTEAIKALLLTLRFFFQNNEPISLYNVQKLVNGPDLSDPDLSADWKAQYTVTRSEINNHLRANTPLYIQKENRNVTRQEIWDAFIWGHYAHSGKREEYLRWKGHGLFPFIRFEFIETLMAFQEGIEYIAEMTQLELSGKPVPALAPDLTGSQQP